MSITRNMFEFMVDSPLSKESIIRKLKGTRHEIEKITANYEFTEDLIFTGISNKYVPFLHCEIKPGRRQGNTIRCVDAAIQILFNEGKVLLVDHWENGNHKFANLDMQQKVRDRLRLMCAPVIKKGDTEPKNTYFVEVSKGIGTLNALWLTLKNYNER
ncbi:hypothetical protein [Tenacibaculum sp.]|uniref:hypothetical protein n=1 Tax=Tenacibaculum sp. TaxID=1906242 RepID=UPI003D0C1AE0